jgi:hypothetical protein
MQVLERVRFAPTIRRPLAKVLRELDVDPFGHNPYRFNHRSASYGIERDMQWDENECRKQVACLKKPLLTAGKWLFRIAAPLVSSSVFQRFQSHFVPPLRIRL